MARRKKSSRVPESTTGEHVNRSEADDLGNHQQHPSPNDDSFKPDSEADAHRFQRDFRWYLEFVNPAISDYALCHHPVWGEIDRAVNTTVKRWNCADIRGDLYNQAYLQLRHHSGYSGTGSIFGYLLKTLSSIARELRRPLVSGEFKYFHTDDETPSAPPIASTPSGSPGSSGFTRSPLRFESLDNYDGSGASLELTDPTTLNQQTNIMKALLGEECMKQLMAKAENSDLHRVAVEMIHNHLNYLNGEEDDDYDITKERLSARCLAKKASTKLGRKVTRYEAGPVIQELKPILEDWLRT